jgi:hypothetical protein
LSSSAPFIRGGDSDRVLEYAYLNSFHRSGLENLLDVAVLQHVELAAGLKVQARFQKIDEMPFDFERLRMSVVLGRDDGVHILICKGAVPTDELSRVVAGTEYGRLARSAAPTGAGCRRRSDRAGLVGSSSWTAPDADQAKTRMLAARWSNNLAGDGPEAPRRSAANGTSRHG